ncbi:EamA family transporter, partial [Streptomyces sp. TRM76130]|nr:EamA family transporter [Streptomyces sp. TRM76130]
STGFGAWGWLLRRHPASSVAPFSLLVPVFGMSSAALFLGESLSPTQACAAVLLVGGAALTSLPSRRRPTEPIDGPAPGRNNADGDVHDAGPGPRRHAGTAGAAVPAARG